MFLQYREIDGIYKLIQDNNRLDLDNKDILDGKYDNSETPLSYEGRMAKIFSDWQQGDILVIADSPLKHPKFQGGTLVEMSREEICATGDLSVLYDGEVYQDSEIKTIPIPDDLFKPKWEYPNWIESMPQEDKEKYHHNIINQLKDEILTIGFEYIQKNETKHQQKTRDKDRSFLDSSISSMKRKSISSIFWSFNDEDIVELTLQELEDLQDDGFEFNQAVFKVEAELKAQAPTKNVTTDTYRQKVNAISSIKCFEK